MQAEIIAIGTEILQGEIVTSNSAWLSKKLAQLGIATKSHITVADDREELSRSVKIAISRSDLIITTGGLGPTVDDITLQTLAIALKRKLKFRPAIMKLIRGHFRRRKIVMPDENRRQAFIPEGAKWFANEVGTAPGFLLEEMGKVLIALPGPPRELKPIFEKNVIPFLKKKYPTKKRIKSKLIKVAGFSESSVHHAVSDLISLDPKKWVGIYAHLGEVHLKITVSGPSEKAISGTIQSIRKKIYGRLGNDIFAEDDETLEEAVGKLLKKRRKTVALAESCTGGLISNRLTNIAGSSAYFREALVAYANEVKIAELNIPKNSIEKYGAVSRDVARLMAKNIREKAKVDFGLAVTGIAGPTGGSRAKPVGLVYIGLSSAKETKVREFRFIGKRREIKFLTSQAALNMLRLRLTESR